MKKTVAVPAGSDAPAATDTSSNTPKTPSKRTPGKKAAGDAKGKSSAKRKNADKSVSEADEAGGDDEESPTKKVKAEKDEDLLE